MSTIIKIHTDDEGFFGSAGSDGVDVETTQENYEYELRKEIKGLYPSPYIAVEFIYKPTMKVVEVISDDFDDLKREEIKSDVEEIIARVYDRGNFWVEK